MASLALVRVAPLVGVAIAAVFASCHSSTQESVASGVDAGDDQATPCPDAGALDAGEIDAATVDLPAACALPAQACNPLDPAACAVGEACDLGRDGTFSCATLSGAGGAPVGAACDGMAGPFCAPALTCVGGVCAPFCCAASDCAGSACAPLRAMKASGGAVGTCAAVAEGGAPDAASDAGSDAAAGDAGATVIGNHAAVFEGRGFLVPWTTWGDALAREMNWYATGCGAVSGYPVFATSVHLDGNCQLTANDAIPAMQDGMGILSYLKYYVRGGRQDAAILAVAQSLGDYLVQQALTPEGGAYPAFPRSTGEAEAVPQPPDCGTQDDQPYEIEPDKGGIAGHALMQLAAETGDATYSSAALRIAQTLVANMSAGTSQSTPWPFRADYRTGVGRGAVSSNLSYILRLFDDLLPAHPELATPRAALWSYIKNVQIPDVFCQGALWAQFFEDGQFPSNRNAWAPLSLARYLLEQRDALDADWMADTQALLGFVNGNFVDPIDGFSVCIEQDFDRKPYGGILSTYGAVAAMYASAAGTMSDRLHAYQSLTLLVYAIDDDGCPADQAFVTGRGGWQEDAHLDKIHNFVDALGAFPDWAD